MIRSNNRKKIKSNYYKDIVRTLADVLMPVTSADIAGLIGGNRKKVRDAINYERNNGSEFIIVEKDPNNKNRNTYSIDRDYYNDWVKKNGPI